MELPASRKQLDKLGKRMADAGRVLNSDSALYADFLEYYQTILDATCEELRKLDLSPTSRVKTTGTLIQKIQREHVIKLSRVNDFAGARVVLSEGGLVEQDACVESVVRAFTEHDRKPQVIDRRIDPRQGYRAVHVIVFPAGTPVEIQIRTAIQDLWAQVFEKFADNWGRDLRYGGLVAIAPNDPNPVRASIGPLITLMTAFLLHLAGGISLAENSRRRLIGIDASLRLFNSIAPELRLAAFESMTDDQYSILRQGIRRVLRNHVRDRRRRGRLIRRSLPKTGRDPARVLRVTLLGKSIVERSAYLERMGAELVEKTTRDGLLVLQKSALGLAEAERLAENE